MHASGLTATAMQGYPRITIISIPTSHAVLVSTCHGSVGDLFPGSKKGKHGNKRTVRMERKRARSENETHAVDARRARRTSVKNKEVWDGVLWTSKKLRFC